MPPSCSCISLLQPRSSLVPAGGWCGRPRCTEGRPQPCQLLFRKQAAPSQCHAVQCHPPRERGRSRIRASGACGLKRGKRREDWRRSIRERRLQQEDRCSNGSECSAALYACGVGLQPHCPHGTRTPVPLFRHWPFLCVQDRAGLTQSRPHGTSCLVLWWDAALLTVNLHLSHS